MKFVGIMGIFFGKSIGGGGRVRAYSYRLMILLLEISQASKHFSTSQVAKQYNDEES